MTLDMKHMTGGEYCLKIQIPREALKKTFESLTTVIPTLPPLSLTALDFFQGGLLIAVKDSMVFFKASLSSNGFRVKMF